MTSTPNRNEQSMMVYPPIRGMNTVNPPHHMPEGQGTDNYNVEIEEVEGINKRQGFTPFNTASVVLPRYAVGTIKEITGVMVYFSGATLTAGVCAASDVIFVKGNSSSIYWQIAALVGTNTASLAVAYTQTITASSYFLGPKQVDGLFNYKYSTTQKLLAFAGSTGFVATAGTTGTFASFVSGLTDYQNISGVTFQDKFWYCNGYEYNVYDGSTNAAVGGSPTPSDPLYIGVYTIGNANWLAIAGSNTAAHKSRLTFSDVNAAETYPTANRYLIGDRDGSVITGHAAISGGWAVYKENSIYVFSGIPGSGSLRKVCDDVGCVAPKSLVEYKGWNIFIGRRGGVLGVYLFDGTPNVQYLSKDIEPTFTALSQGNVSKFCGEIYEGKYVCGTRNSSGTWNNEHYSYYIDRPFTDKGTMHWSWVRGNRGYQSLLNQNISGVNYLFSGSPTGGFIYREDYGNSDDITDNNYGGTAAISAYADSAWIFMGDQSRNKELLRGYIDATQSGDWDLKMRLYQDFSTYGYSEFTQNLGSSVMIWSDVIFLSTPWQTAVDKAISELVFPYPAIAKHFKFRWMNDQAGQPFTVYPFQIFWKMESR